jgi:hypothetical protein
VPGADADLPGWQRLLARPRRLHRLATGTLWLAAAISGLAAYVRAAPGGAAPDVLPLTYIFAFFAWVLVLVAACAEAYVASLTAGRTRAGNRTQYLIVLIFGLVIAVVLCVSLAFLAAADPVRIGLIGRIVTAIVAGMLPLIVGVALTAGLTLLWVERLRPLLEARLEAQIREYEQRRKPTE